MSPSAKQIEIQRRSRRILSVGFELMREGGLRGVRLERIAEIVGCTRGTLYNHFKNREEILVAMAARAVQSRIRLFEQAIAMTDSTREKIASVCLASMVYADELPLEFAMEHAIRHETIWQRTSAARQQVFRENELACMTLVGEVINTAIGNRDLPLPAGLTADQMIERVTFGLWSMSFGGLVIEATSPSLKAVGIHDARSTIHHNCNALLDSFGWAPHFDPLKYQAFLKQLTPRLKQHAKKLAADQELED